MSDIPDNAPPPRLCDIIKCKDFVGYGFNLHADKNRPGQFIGKVDPDSPAERAGLKEGDRIIEVNDVNIANENHKQVVQRIKAVDNQTRLLVVDLEADKFYKSHNIVVNHKMANVIHKSSEVVKDSTNIPTPLPDVTKSANTTSTTTTLTPTTNGHHEDDRGSVGSVASSSTHSEISSHSQSQMSTSPSPPPTIDTVTPPQNTNKTSSSPSVDAKNLKNMGGLNWNMSVDEMKEYLKRKRRPDPRKDTSSDLKEKYKIIQSL